MKALLLSAPSKTTEEVNWTKPLNNYLLSVYGNTTEFQDDLKKFNELRQRIQGLAADDAAGVELYLDYYSRLELVDLRIPMSTVNKRKPVKFSWTDAFVPTAEQSQTVLPYEKACVLFNLGSLLMKAAALKYSDAHRSASTDEDSFKMAIQSMQQAAGVFTYLSESFLHGPSSDLKPSTVKFLSNLCLAQSQEMFTLKVIDGDLEQKKNSLISKLCASAAKYYEDSFDESAHLADEDSDSDFGITEAGLDDEILGDDVEAFEYDPAASESNTSKVSARLHPSWIAVFHVKFLYYRSLAFYFQGLQLETAKKYGESIAYLTKSSEFLHEISPSLVKTATKSRAHNVYDLLDNLEYQKDALKIKLGDLTKDNDLIYHDIIPSLVTLAEPKPMNSAKAIAMNKIEAFAKINESNYNNFLSKVVPVSIHELLSFYSEEKSQFLRNEIDAVDISNEELSSALEYLNLPRALVSIKELLLAEKPLDYGAQESHLDTDSLKKVEEISSKYAQDTNNRNVVSLTRASILECVGRMESLLNSAPSSTSQGQFRDDLIKLKRSLYDAALSDARLFSLIDQDNSAFYRAIGQGMKSDDFRRLFSVPETEQKTYHQEPEISLLDVDDRQLSKIAVKIEDKITRLEDLLNELNTVKTGKAKLISELKMQIHDDDISDILLINSRVKSTNEIKEVIFPEELRKFESYSGKLNQLINKQKSLVNDVKKYWEELISSPKVRDIQTSSTFRNGLLNEQKAKIDAFYEKNWKKYTVGLQRGVGFYQQLLDYARNLHTTIERQTQMGSLTQSLGTLGLGSDVTGGSISSMTSTNSHAQGAHQYPSAPGPKAQQAWPGAFAGVGQNPKINSGLSSGEFQNTGSSSLFAPTSSSTINAPQLPPKRPSQSAIPGKGPDSGVDPRRTETSVQQPAPASPFDSGNRSTGAGNGNGNGSGLIYDQPSAYQPNMYDYFAQNNRG